MKQFKYIAGAMLFIGLALASCDKDDDKPEETPGDTNKEVMLVIKPMMGNDPIQLNTNYTVNGQVLNFDYLKFYVSGIELIDDDENILANNGEMPVLASTEQNAEMIGSTNVEHFHMLKFNIGLDSLLNHADPITAPEPLNDVEMHWNWNPTGGYKFLRMEGTVDGDEFVSHAATDPLFQEDIMVSAHSVSAAGDHIHIELLVDFEEVLEGHTVPGGNSHGNPPFNVSYMDNIGTGAPFSIQ